MKKLFQPLALFAIVVAMLVPDDLFAQRIRIFNGPAFGPVFNGNNCQNGQCQTQAFWQQPTFTAPQLQYPVPQLLQSKPVSPCETAAQLPDGAQITADQWYTILVGPNGRTLTDSEKSAAKEWSMRAARTYQGNGCGTSSLCGRDSTATYWMTNAHVASTTIGRQCRCQVVENGVIRTFTTEVVEAAYSSRTRTDWALCKGPPDILSDVEPIKLSKEKPDPNKITATWGCPRCEPVRGQIVETVAMGSVWYWLPNSIGGQSGSAMIQEGNQVGLLTWTENGKGSGQFTATIWAQSRNQNTDGPARTGFEIPVTAVPDGIELREGYFAADKETGDLGEYPIWSDGAPPPPPGQKAKYVVELAANDATAYGGTSAMVLKNADGTPGQLVVTGSQLAKIGTNVTKGQAVDLAIGAAITEAEDSAENVADTDFGRFKGLRDRLKERGYDWIAILNLIMQLIELFSKKS